MTNPWLAQDAVNDEIGVKDPDYHHRSVNKAERELLDLMYAIPALTRSCHFFDPSLQIQKNTVRGVCPLLFKAESEVVRCPVNINNDT